MGTSMAAMTASAARDASCPAGQFWRAGGAGALVGLASGCSIKRIASTSLGDALAKEGSDG